MELELKVLNTWLSLEVVAVRTRAVAVQAAIEALSLEKALEETHPLKVH